MKALKSFFQYLIVRYYSLRYRLDFTKGYEYEMIRHTNLNLLEAHHSLMIMNGWERFSDVKAGFSTAWCWYRKKVT